MNNRNSLSLATLILGCLSLIPLLGFITGTIAIILGIISLIQINKSSESGKGMTITGLFIGLAGIIIWVLIYGSLINLHNKSIEDGTFDRLSEQGTKISLATLIGKIEMYNKENRQYPENLDFLDTEEFISKTDFFGNHFFYEKTKDSYDLRSFGKDGKNGTKDDIFP